MTYQASRGRKQKKAVNRMVTKKRLKPMTKDGPENAKLVSSETVQHFLDTYTLFDVLIRCSRQDIITDDGVLFCELVSLLSDSRHKTRRSEELFERILQAKARMTFEPEEF